MKAPAPPRVEDVTKFWREEPNPHSKRCDWWLNRIASGWQRNRRVGMMGYHEAAHYFGVYIWEYLHVLYPALREQEEEW